VRLSQFGRGRIKRPPLAPFNQLGASLRRARLFMAMPILSGGARSKYSALKATYRVFMHPILTWSEKQFTPTRIHFLTGSTRNLDNVWFWRILWFSQLRPYTFHFDDCMIS